MVDETQVKTGNYYDYNTHMVVSINLGSFWWLSL